MPGKPLRILLSARAMDACGDRARRVLGERLAELVVSESAGPTPDIDIGFVTRDVIGASARNKTVASTQRFFDQLLLSPNLKWLQVNAAGADREAFVELRGRGVLLTSAAGANGAVVAQTALAGFLALSRRLPQLMAAQKHKQWKPLVVTGLPRDLQGQRAVVVGWGSIGRKLGEWLAALGLEVIVVRHSDVPAGVGLETSTFKTLHTVLPRADWVFLACQLGDETRGLMDARAFAAMPKGAHLVNVARGEVVVEPDLIAALRSGHLGGAFLDVFAHEPLDPASPLWEMENVIVTPHSAGQSDGIYARVVEIFLENLALWLAGKPLRNVVGA
jgi:phosphoglycerate dehydrogenase-like enzyme